MKLVELAALAGGQLRGDGAQVVTDVAGLFDATVKDVSYLTSARHLKKEPGRINAGCLLVSEFYDEIPSPQIKVDDPELIFFTVVVEKLRPRPLMGEGISELAYVDQDATISDDVTVMPYAYISAGVKVGDGSVVGMGVFVGSNAKVGSGCVLYPNVVLMDGVTLGDRVIVHAGTVIGSDGFGYMQRQGMHIKKPHVGGVIIGDDVEIQANCAIDRGALGDTVIGAGSKLDNMVHIAHNVSVGDGSLLTGQTAVAGSSSIGKYVILAGQAGVKDHVEVADNVVIAAKAAVLSDIKTAGVYAGSPAIPVREWLRASTVFPRLPEMQKKIRALEKRLEEIEKKGESGDDEC